jgi:hypothetical protein
MIPYYIDYNFQEIEVPMEIVYYCEEFTQASRNDLRFFDCVSMHMGYYGNHKEHLQKLRDEYIY